jgi:hypothetical protein
MHYRTPVVIFLSDGESYIEDEHIFDLCYGAIRQGFVRWTFYVFSDC